MGQSPVLALLGRVFLSSVFLASAFGKIAHFGDTADFMTAHGIPASEFFCVLSILIETVGGLSLAFGVFARAGAALLALFLVPVTVVFHAGPEQRVQLVKNLAIFGGLVEVMAFGAGEISVDGTRR